jgi:FkbM family methyltransferase
METIFEIPKLRCGHRVGTGQDSAYWFEMDHPGESARSLLDIFDLYLNQYGWDRYITNGATCVDIGGHSGDTAVPMAYLSRGTVLAVEPNPMIKQYLDLCCNMNGHLAKLITADEAITTQSGVSVEILDHNNAMCNGGMIDPSWTLDLQDRMRQNHGKSITANGLTLQDLCSKYLSQDEINRIGFIKTDTEGHDGSILKSSGEFLNSLKPHIFTEWFFAYTDVETKQLFDIINEINYVPFYPGTAEVANINKRSEDLILIHRDRIQEMFP